MILVKFLGQRQREVHAFEVITELVCFWGAVRESEQAGHSCSEKISKTFQAGIVLPMFNLRRHGHVLVANFFGNIMHSHFSCDRSELLARW